MASKNGVYQQRRRPTVWYSRTVRFRYHTLNPSDSVPRKHLISASIDISRPAQLRDIEASFAACNNDFSLEELRHPNNPKLTAVESYPVLPDAEIWANQYDLFRFSERPGERPVDVTRFFIVSRWLF